MDRRSRNFSKSHTPRKSAKKCDEKIATTTTVLKKGFNGFFLFLINGENLQPPLHGTMILAIVRKAKTPPGFHVKHALKIARSSHIIIHVGVDTHAHTVYDTCYYGTAGVVQLDGSRRGGDVDVEPSLSSSAMSSSCERRTCSISGSVKIRAGYGATIR